MPSPDEIGGAEHGAQEKSYGIVVNGRPRTAEGPEICFDRVVLLAYDPVPTGDLVTITVTYHRGQGNKPQGTLTATECVRLKKGMEFDVTVTDRS